MSVGCREISPTRVGCASPSGQSKCSPSCEAAETLPDAESKRAHNPALKTETKPRQNGCPKTRSLVERHGDGHCRSARFPQRRCTLKITQLEPLTERAPPT